MSSKKALAWNLLVPFLMLLVSEGVTGNLLRLFAPGVVLGTAVYYILYLGVFFFAGTTKVSWLLLNLAVYGLAAGEYFVISFRERPAMIWDVLALRTAMTVSANYRFTVTPRLVFTFLGTLLLGIGSWKVPLRLENRKIRWKARGAWAGVTAAFAVLLYGVLTPALKLSVPMWDPIISFERQGFLLSTVLSLETLFPRKPAGYETETARQLLERLEEEAAAGADTGTAADIGTAAEAKAGEKAGNEAEIRSGNEAVVPENVICIMNESFADLRIFNGLVSGNSFETDGPFLSHYDSLSENAQKGWLYVPVFGAMTANSEYEFLTGNSCAFVPQGSIPYQFYTKPGDGSLARVFGEAGYRTVAMHPYPGYNWNRTEAYENLGFDEFLDQDYYEASGFLDEEETGGSADSRMPRGYLSDAADYEALIRQVEEKEPGEKLFLFNVTMQNHGGYEVADFPADVHVTAVNGGDCLGEYPKADQYLTLMKRSDEALKILLDYFSACSQPTLIVLFGDHEPSVETSFYEALYGTRWSQVPGEQKRYSFVTPYLIWSNYERDAGDLGDMSAFMLGGQVLRAAGMEAGGFGYAVERLRGEYPMVHSMGLLTRDGQFLDVLETGTLDLSQTVKEYHTLQYYRMFEEKPE